MPKNNLSLLTRSLNLPQFDDIFDLSITTGLSTKLIYNLSMNQSRYYKQFIIPKKNGTNRTIYAPKYTMYIFQKWILRNILDKIIPTNRAMGFRKNNIDSIYGYKANANYHTGTLYGLAIDLKDFFPSIKSNKVYEIFSSLGYSKAAATILTNICTVNNSLPPGAVCSPSLSNLICITLDQRLIGLCDKRGIRYTRYADDLYFSCDNKESLLMIYKVILKIINNEGFEINGDKTRYHSPKNKKLVTGITIAKMQDKDEYELKANKNTKRNLRATIHSAIMSGDYSKRSNILGVISNINYIESYDTHAFLNKIKKYIYECAKKIVHFKELVERYNDNLFFKDLKKMAYAPPEFNRIYNLEYNLEFFFNDNSKILTMLERRKSFLQKHNLADICTYCDWPEKLTESNELVSNL